MVNLLILEEVMQKALDDDRPNLALFINKDSIFEIECKRCDIVFYCGQYKELLNEEVIVAPLLPDLKPNQIYPEIYKKIQENCRTILIAIKKHEKALGDGKITQIYQRHIDFYNLEDSLPRNMRQIFIVSNSLFEVNERRRQYKKKLDGLIEQIESHAVL